MMDEEDLLKAGNFDIVKKYYAWCVLPIKLIKIKVWPRIL
jgi:hypothetical protein